MRNLLITAAVSASLMLTQAQASVVTFEFDGATGAGGAIDAPANNTNIMTACGSLGADFCTINAAQGFDYTKGGVSFNAAGFSSGALEEGDFQRGRGGMLIQDLLGPNQGLGVISPSEGGPIGISDDQINFETGESILFTFKEEVTLTDIFVNDGLGHDCPGGGNEGPCGAIGVIINGDVIQTLTEYLAFGVLAAGGQAVTLLGSTFEFFSLTPGAGYSVEGFTVLTSDNLTTTPVPAALPLLLSGLAGLGFASRGRRKKR